MVYRNMEKRARGMRGRGRRVEGLEKANGIVDAGGEGVICATT